jgi:hypothetical protein
MDKRLAEMFAELEGSEITAPLPSQFWMELNKKHCEHLDRHGFENFKRTLAKEYFTWTRIWPWDSQIRFLLRRLPLKGIALAAG